jgi:hypothetical protein
MRFKELCATHRFWLERQEEGKPAFQLKNVLPKHQREGRILNRKGKGKAKEVYVEVDTDEDEMVTTNTNPHPARKLGEGLR